MWGDHDRMMVVIKPIIVEKGVRYVYENRILERIYIKKSKLRQYILSKYKYNDICCYVECRTQDREMLPIMNSDWEHLEKEYDISMVEIINECENLQAYCDLNNIIFEVETKRLTNEPAWNPVTYVTKIFVGTLHNYKTKQIWSKEYTRNRSISYAYTQAKDYLSQNHNFNSKINYRKLSQSPPINKPTQTPIKLNESPNQTPIKPNETTQASIKPDESPIQAPIKSNESHNQTFIKPNVSSNQVRAKIQVHNLRLDRWDVLPIQQIETVTLGDLCSQFASVYGNKAFNARLIINDEMALSLYRSSGLDGKLDQFPIIYENPILNMVIDPQDPIYGYQVWLKGQTKSVQKGLQMLCEVCRDEVGTYFDFKERSCGVNYCQTCIDKKIALKNKTKTAKEEIVKLVTPDEDLRKDGYHVTLIGWKGGEKGRPTSPIFEKVYVVYDTPDKYHVDDRYPRQTIWSAWNMDYGLLEMILKKHNLGGSNIIPSDGWFNLNYLDKNKIAYFIPTNLSISEIIERIGEYYEGFYLMNEELMELSDQGLVDCIYDNDKLRYQINGKHYKYPVQSCPFLRRQALLILGNRKNVNLIHQVCQVIIKSKDNNLEHLKPLGNMLYKENESIYESQLSQILNTTYTYPPKDELYNK